MNNILAQFVSVNASSGLTGQKVYVSHSMMTKDRSKHTKLIILDPRLNWIFVPIKILAVLLAHTARKTSFFNGPGMDTIPNLRRTYTKMNINREQHNENTFKHMRSGSTTDTPAIMLTTPVNRIDDLSSIIERIMELHTTLFSRKYIVNSFVKLMPLVASQIFETEKNKAGNNISN